MNHGRALTTRPAYNGERKLDSLGRVFNCSTDAVFGIDGAGRVRYANTEFGRLLGYDCAQLRGRWCADVLCGTDMHGRPFCGRDCPIPKNAVERPATGDFDLVVRRADGDSMLVNIGATYIPPHLQPQSGQVNVFFSLRAVHARRLLQRMAMAPLSAAERASDRGCARLTSRERQVLDLAAKGMKTEAIAVHLSVSTQTVRTHFKNIYPKLGVSTRTEAVIFALRHGLH